MIDTFKNISIILNNENDTTNNKLNNTGTLYATNIRIIWINDKNNNFNISVPWIQISSAKGENNPSFGI